MAATGTNLQIPFTFFNSIATDAATSMKAIAGAAEDSRTESKSYEYCPRKIICSRIAWSSKSELNATLVETIINFQASICLLRHTKLFCKKIKLRIEAMRSETP